VACGTLSASTCYIAVNTLLGFLKISPFHLTSCSREDAGTQVTSESQLTNDCASSSSRKALLLGMRGRYQFQAGDPLLSLSAVVL